MLRLIVLGEELYNEETEKFTTSEDVVLELEHSLVSLSKWESIFCKPFLGPDTKTTEETLGYVNAMIVTDDYPDDIVSRMNEDHFGKINEYIGSSMTGTTFGRAAESKPQGRPEIVTSELVYYWMVTFKIPFEAEHWHLSRLFALIKICSIKNGTQKKLSRSELAAQHRSLNEQRKAKYGTTG